MKSAFERYFASPPHPKKIAYITYADPDHERSIEIAAALADSGVDILEYGIPFTDPLADGPVIQRANTRSLKNGFSMKRYFNAVERIRSSCAIKIATFSYLNPIYAYGMDRFFKDAASAGIQASVVLDLPPEEAKEYRIRASEASVDTVFLASPTTSADRLKVIARACKGFLYYVMRAGVTGERGDMPAHVIEELDVIKKAVKVPVAAGFGISSQEQVKALAPHVDGVIVGSAIVRAIEENACAKDLIEKVSFRAKSLFS